MIRLSISDFFEISNKFTSKIIFHSIQIIYYYNNSIFISTFNEIIFMIIKCSVNNYLCMNLIFEFQQSLRPKNILAVGEDKEKKTEVRTNI